MLCRLPEREREKEKGRPPPKDLLIETRERREAQEREAARAAHERRETERAQPRQAPAPREAARRPDDRHLLPERCATCMMPQLPSAGTPEVAIVAGLAVFPGAGLPSEAGSLCISRSA